MDEIDENNTATGVDRAFTVLNEGPPPLTSRQQKTKQGDVDGWEEATAQYTLAAFPALYPQESDAVRMLRADGQQRCWAALEARLQATLEETDAAVFAALLDLAQCRHLLPAAAAALPRFGLHRLPTGLVLAGGGNSADHARTFPNLVAHLRSAGCYTALLHPAAFSQSLGEALNEALRQLSGLDSPADQFAALAAWYADETGAGLADPPSAAAAAADSSGGGEALASEEAEAEDAATVGARLRARAATTTSSTSTIRGRASPAQSANRHRPVVVVVEGAEALDPRTLADFISTLSEGYPALPVCLVVGLTTTAAALQAALPPHLVDRALDCTHFNLATAISRLDAVVRQVLLGPWPGLLLSSAVVGILWDRFLLHCFSPGAIWQGALVAALAHFRTQPASCLAAAALEGGREGLTRAFAQLPAAAATQVARAVGATRAGAAAAVADAQDAWQRWALALHLVVAAAQAVGMTNGYTYWQLYRDALVPGFTTSEQGREALQRLERQLLQLDVAGVGALAARLGELVGGREGEGGWKEEALALVQSLTEVAQGAQGGEGRGTGAVGEASTAGPALAAEAAAEAEAEAAVAPTRRRNDRFHSKSSRKEALITKARVAGKARALTKLPEPAAVAQPGVAQLLPWITAALRSPPTQHPGAVAFTCRDTSALDCLTAAPRQAIHDALMQPQLFLEEAGSSSAAALAGLQALGVHPGLEDPCLAYQLFDQDPSCVNVADWFTSFADVLAPPSPPSPAAAAGSSASGSKKKGKAALKGKQSAGSKEREEEDAAREAARRQELAARFSHAAAELQFVGMIKPAKRRRGNAVQRAVHMPALTLGE